MFEDTNRKAVSAEVMGTFFLVFVGLTAAGALAGVDEAGNATGLFGAAFAFGATLMVLMHVMGPISGCHLNPAVSIGNFMSNKMSQDDTIAYVLGQVVGAFIAFAMMAKAPFGMDDNIAILGAAAVGTAFFVIVLLSTQEPWAVGGALFVVTAMASGFGDVNPGVLAGEGINDVVVLKDVIDNSTLYAMIGGVIGAIAGWAVKDNVLD
jgi:aquaporin Z